MRWGWGTLIDVEIASDWYRLSAEHGHDWAQYNFANLLFDGRGVPAGRGLHVEAEWFARAAAASATDEPSRYLSQSPDILGSAI
jgi:TPR repeat protein